MITLHYRWYYGHFTVGKLRPQHPVLEVRCRSSGSKGTSFIPQTVSPNPSGSGMFFTEGTWPWILSIEWPLGVTLRCTFAESVFPAYKSLLGGQFPPGFCLFSLLTYPCICPPPPSPPPPWHHSRRPQVCEVGFQIGSRPPAKTTAGATGHVCQFFRTHIPTVSLKSKGTDRISSPRGWWPL